MKQTWLTPFWNDWQHRYGGDPPAGPLAKTLKPLIAKHGETTVRLAWRRFLTAHDAQYVNVPKFGQTFGAWTGEKPKGLGKADKSVVEAQEWSRE